MANQGAGTLSVVDPETNTVAGAPLPAGTRPDGVAAGKGVVWLASAGSDAVTRFEADGQVVPTAKVPVGDRPEAISLGKQLVWVANVNDGTVNRIDRASPAVVGSPIGVGSKPAGIFVGRRFVWVTNSGDDTVTRIDPSTAQVVGAPISVGRDPRGVIETRAGRLGGERRRRHRHAPRSAHRRAARRADPGRRDPRQLAFGSGFVWVANNDDNTVTRLDPQPGRVAGAPIPVGGRPLGIASGAGAIWVSNHARPHDRRASSRDGHMTGFFHYPPAPSRARGEPARIPRPAAARTTGRCCSTTPRRGSSRPASVVLSAGEDDRALYLLWTAG